MCVTVRRHHEFQRVGDSLRVIDTRGMFNGRPLPFLHKGGFGSHRGRTVAHDLRKL